MSVLLAHEIEKEIKKGNIFVKPFNKKNLAINSIDVTLNNKLYTYEPVKVFYSEKLKSFVAAKYEEDSILLDMKKENKVYEVIIPEEGLVLLPGILYLGSTNEKAGSDKYIPMYEGRSSMARLGIQSHISAGFGDLGFKSNWTLEIAVVHRIKIYPNIRIGQVYFHKVEKESLKQAKKYIGKYVNQEEATASKSYEDFK